MITDADYKDKNARGMYSWNNILKSKNKSLFLYFIIKMLSRNDSSALNYEI